MRVTVNDRPETVPEMAKTWSLLTVLREVLQLSGPKFGCGVGQCGACTVLVDGQSVRSCLISVDSVAERSVHTIEGMNGDPVAERVKKAWIDNNVAQCGYCQSGQIVSAVALLREVPSPTDDDINQAMDGNLCRCGTYGRIRQAIKDAAGQR